MLIKGVTENLKYIFRVTLNTGVLGKYKALLKRRENKSNGKQGIIILQDIKIYANTYV